MRHARKLAARLEKIRETRKNKSKYKVIDFPNLTSYKPEHVLSNTIDSGGFNKDKLYSHRWRKGCVEKASTVKEMEKKSRRIRPKFGKSGYSYASDGDNEGVLNIYTK